MIQNHIKGITKDEADGKIDFLLSQGQPKLIEFLIKNRDKHIAKLIFERFNITPLHPSDFIGLLPLLVCHKQFNLIQKYIEYRHTNNLHETADQVYYRSIFDALTFKSEEEKQIIKSLLKI